MRFQFVSVSFLSTKTRKERVVMQPKFFDRLVLSCEKQSGFHLSSVYKECTYTSALNNPERNLS